MRFLLLRIFVENEDYSINIEHIAWSTAITSKLLPKLQMNNLIHSDQTELPIYLCQRRIAHWFRKQHFLSINICPNKPRWVLAFHKGMLSNAQLERCQNYLTICIFDSSLLCKYGFSALTRIICNKERDCLELTMNEFTWRHWSLSSVWFALESRHSHCIKNTKLFKHIYCIN